MQHDAAMLRDYLVAGVEDPRVNAQSILTRHSLIHHLFPGRFEALMEHELRFSAVLSWAGRILAEAGGNDDLRAIEHALRRGADDAEGIRIPRFVLTTYAGLPAAAGDLVVPNYLGAVFAQDVEGIDAPAPAPAILSTFADLWHGALRDCPTEPLTVLELACGSANDYRFFNSFGLARWIDYTGVDLCEKNIQNALEMFPQVRFAIGNALEINAPARAFAATLAQDLFEHLSPAALDRAMDEVCRVTDRILCLGLFNAWEGDEHLVQPLADYHWSRLSIPRLRQRLEQDGFDVRVIHIDTLLKWRCQCAETHNPNAYTLLAERRHG